MDTTLVQAKQTRGCGWVQRLAFGDTADPSWVEVDDDLARSSVSGGSSPERSLYLATGNPHYKDIRHDFYARTPASRGTGNAERLAIACSHNGRTGSVHSCQRVTADTEDDVE